MEANRFKNSRNHSNLSRLVLAALVLFLLQWSTATFALDGVAITVTDGPEPGQITLDWEGGQPLFMVYRSTSAVGIEDPANKIGETTSRTWVDTPPAGDRFFYLVRSPCLVDPPERCDGIDNDCNGEVDEPGAEDSCDLANATPTCQAGACTVSACDSGFDDCDGDGLNGCEVDLISDATNCGLCGNVCGQINGTTSCGSGECVVDACDPGFDDCDGDGVNGCEAALDSDPLHCGSCGNACDLANASTTCGAGACELTACNPGFDNCDGDTATGCETATDIDPMNCGGCGTVCSVPNATSTCGAGACNIGNCDADFWDINGDPADGCEYACVFISATDEPDSSHIDENCDGVDGDAFVAVFASPIGDDLNPGTSSLPVQTIARALEVAGNEGRTQVLLDIRTFSESVTLVDGISLYGGYDADNGWARLPDSNTTIQGGTTALQATSIITDTVLEQLEIISSNATASGSSSYGIFADASPGLWVRDSTVQAGAGAAGSSGNYGSYGSGGGPGQSGRPGCENSTGFGCSSCSRPTGGNGGYSACGNSGGRGGNAGAASSNGSAGSWGIGPSGGGGGFGAPDGNGNWNPSSGYVGRNGGAGATGVNGSQGQGSFTAAGYTATDGTNGSNGGPGSGGGGGGGGGGGTASCDSYGGGGGGGGSGGCGGNPGTGATSGGGSFAVYLVDSDVRIERSILRTGGGGSGGNGGVGGSGGNGGTGGNCGGNKGNCYGGSSEQDDGSNGGRGGYGGTGGRGGHGGNGAGGSTAAIVRVGTSNPDLDGNNFEVGQAGTGGAASSTFAPDGLATSVWPPYCGNGHTDNDEDCDDGDTADGDGCDATCRVEPEWSCDGSPSLCGQTGPVLIAHYGDVSPTAAGEGWISIDNHAGVLFGAHTGDRGLNAWRIDDNSTVSGSRRFYQHGTRPTAADVAEATANGWALRLRLRVVDIPDTVDASVYSEYSNGTTRWMLTFGSSQNGDPIVRTTDGQTLTLSDLDDGYHLYELVWDPDTGTADLFVDGVERLSNDTGGALALTRVTFGANQSNSTGQGNYNLVEWMTLTCGNGVIDSGEDCDDGNLTSGDGCNRVCRSE